jgi:spermidine synthase
MKIWQNIEQTPIPKSEKQLALFQHEQDFAIRLNNGFELMNSQAHGSEDALGEMPCQSIRDRKPGLHVLVAGLGLGFTLAAALKNLPEDARVTVAEVVPGVVAWNEGPLAVLNGDALKDPRVTIYTGDVAKLIKQSVKTFDVMIWDLDDGPEGPGSSLNDWLYSIGGLTVALSALTEIGLLAIWSSGADNVFVNRLKKAGFDVEEKRVRAHKDKGAHYLIWLARKARKRTKRGVARNFRS